MDYKEVVNILEDYNFIKKRLKVKKIDLIETIGDYNIIQAIDYSATGKITDVSKPTESFVVRKTRKQEEIEMEIQSITKQIKEIELLVNLLDPVEKEIIELYYFSNKTWSFISSKVNYSERWCRAIRNTAIKKILRLKS